MIKKRTGSLFGKSLEEDLERYYEKIIKRIIPEHVVDDYRQYVRVENGEVVVDWENVMRLCVGRTYDRNLYNYIVKGLLLLKVLTFREVEGHRLMRDDGECRNLLFFERFVYFTCCSDAEECREILTNVTENRYKPIESLPSQ